MPVGEDQKQHIELTRDIAAKFNHDYGVDFFPLTEPVIEGAATRVMSLRDGTKKMSKSDPSDMSRINLTDDADAIAQKIRKARTDPEPLPETVDGLAGRAEATNLVNIYAALADTDAGGGGGRVRRPAVLRLQARGSPTSRSAHLAPITGRMAELMADPARSTASSATAPSGPRRSPSRSSPGPTRSSGCSGAGGRADACLSSVARAGWARAAPEGTGMILALAVLIGIVAGSRTMTAPAARGLGAPGSAGSTSRRPGRASWARSGPC